MRRTFKFETPEEVERFEEYCNDLSKGYEISQTISTGNKITVFARKRPSER